MSNAIVWERGKKIVRVATSSDVPNDHPIAIDAQREAMVVSPFQAKTALEAAGLLTQVEGIIAAADATTQRAWSEAVEFKRLSPTILALANSIGLTDTQIDDLFRSAAGIEA